MALRTGSHRRSIESRYMTSALARRLDRLKIARRPRIPLRCLVLCETMDENRAGYRRVFAEGRITEREPVLILNHSAGSQRTLQVGERLISDIRE